VRTMTQNPIFAVHEAPAFQRARGGARVWMGWLPLMVLPAAAIAVRNLLPAWAFMWLLAVAIFAGCKWETFWRARSGGDSIPAARALGYLIAWPGMDAQAFFEKTSTGARVRGTEWIWAATKTICGAALLWGVARRIPSSLLAGWVGMLGLILLLHFGTFHIVALAWRRAGVNAQPIMRAPIAATSLSSFWGQRWNLGFRQLTYALVFQPARRRLGLPVATLLAFAASGLIHDLVISLPARAGYGLPTAYFVLQGLGVLAERSLPGRRIGLDGGLRGWLFTALCTAGPAYWCFHPAFVTRVMLPFMRAVGAL
jgi:hypothetical protein